MAGKVRKFATGATRDTDEGKLDYEGFFSPLVLERRAEYMNKHRVQSDGSLRASDNWQKGFGENHREVCAKSTFRHFHDFWKLHRGCATKDRKTGDWVDIEEAICAQMFNLESYLHDILKAKQIAPLTYEDLVKFGDMVFSRSPKHQK